MNRNEQNKTLPKLLLNHIHRKADGENSARTRKDGQYDNSRVHIPSTSPYLDVKENKSQRVTRPYTKDHYYKMLCKSSFIDLILCVQIEGEIEWREDELSTIIEQKEEPMGLTHSPHPPWSRWNLRLTGS
jgi:hypothetical protein